MKNANLDTDTFGKYSVHALNLMQYRPNSLNFENVRYYSST